MLVDTACGLCCCVLVDTGWCWTVGGHCWWRVLLVDSVLVDTACGLWWVLDCWWTLVVESVVGGLLWVFVDTAGGLWAVLVDTGGGECTITVACHWRLMSPTHPPQYLACAKFSTEFYLNFVSFRAYRA